MPAFDQSAYGRPPAKRPPQNGRPAEPAAPADPAAPAKPAGGGVYSSHQEPGAASAPQQMQERLQAGASGPQAAGPAGPQAAGTFGKGVFDPNRKSVGRNVGGGALGQEAATGAQNFYSDQFNQGAKQDLAAQQAPNKNIITSGNGAGLSQQQKMLMDQGAGSNNQTARPGSPTGASATPGTSGGEGFNYDDVREQWADALATSQQGLDDQMLGIDADEARNGRRSAEMNAGMGASVGGNFSGGQVQAQLGGSLLRSQARAEHNKQQLEMKMGFLNSMLQSARHQQDLALQEKLQGEINATQLELAAAQNETQMSMNTANNLAAYDQMMAGQTDPTESGTGGPSTLDGVMGDNPPAGKPSGAEKGAIEMIGGQGGNIPANYHDWVSKDWLKYLSSKEFMDSPHHRPDYNPQADMEAAQSYVDGMNPPPTPAQKDDLMRFMFWYRAKNGIWPNGPDIQNEYSNML